MSAPASTPCWVCDGTGLDPRDLHHDIDCVACDGGVILRAPWEDAYEAALAEQAQREAHAAFDEDRLMEVVA